MAEQERKRTQVDRLLDAMVHVVNRRGYAGASVAAVIDEAGVSRATFYHHYADREGALIAAIEREHATLAVRARSALAATEPAEAWAALAGALTGYAAHEREGARFLTGEAMSGGPPALAARDRSLAELARALEDASRAVGWHEEVPDIDPLAWTGGVYRMLAARLRRGELVTPGLSEEVLAWLMRYARPAHERRWSSFVAGAVVTSARHPGELAIERMPRGLAAGRPRLAPGEVAENQRRRLLHATAKLAASKGYAASTVAEIARVARVRTDTFYGQFADKQEAFLAVHEHGFQQAMDVTVKAYFGAQGWPARSWEALRALSGLLQANPLVAHAAFVEGYAAGPRAVQRLEDAHTAFLFFLQEGVAEYEDPPGRVAMEGMIAAVFEMVYLEARAGARRRIAARLPQLAQIWLTPFLGGAAADAFIDAQTAQPAAP